MSTSDRQKDSSTSEGAAPSRALAAERRLRRVRRAVYAIVFVGIVLVIGTLGFRYIEGMTWINAFYFECMLATGQGPPIPLVTDAGKIFASVMAFVSIGSVLTTLVVVIGPIIGHVWAEAAHRVETEARRLEQEAVGEIRRLEHRGSGGDGASDPRPR